MADKTLTSSVSLQPDRWFCGCTPWRLSLRQHLTPMDMTTPLSHLPQLLQNMRPMLHDGVYVFVTLGAGDEADGLEPVATFREEEGMTMIIEEGLALRAGLQPLFRASWITLQVHSDLQAVGLTAVVATALAGAGISCNVVAAAFHDHLFVPVEKAQTALTVLQQLQGRSQATAAAGPA